MSCGSAFSLPRLELRVGTYQRLPSFERLKSEVLLKKPEESVITGVTDTDTGNISSRLWCRHLWCFLQPLTAVAGVHYVGLMHKLPSLGAAD